MDNDSICDFENAFDSFEHCLDLCINGFHEILDWRFGNFEKEKRSVLEGEDCRKIVAFLRVFSHNKDFIHIIERRMTNYGEIGVRNVKLFSQHYELVDVDAPHFPSNPPKNVRIAEVVILLLRTFDFNMGKLSILFERKHSGNIWVSVVDDANVVEGSLKMILRTSK